MTINTLHKLSIIEVSNLLKAKEVSPVELTESLLENIKELNIQNNIFINILYESALMQAKEAEKEILMGNYRGLLHGIPISIKDNIHAANTPCTNGSIIDQNRKSTEDALIVRNLRNSGAIIIGKTNMDEYANHVTGINKHFGIIRNPQYPGYIVGGSSGGSAVSVSNHLAFGSIGTDTSGSVRIPAALANIYGIKFSYNLMPMKGIQPLSWTLDHGGVFARNCSDLFNLVNAILPGTGQPLDKLTSNIKLNSMKIGILNDSFVKDTDDEILNMYQKVIRKMANYGAKLKAIKIDHLTEKLKSQEVIIGAESAQIHYERLLKHEKALEHFNKLYFNHGLSIKTEDYLDALNIKQQLSIELENILNELDIILVPTLPMLTPKIPSKAELTKFNSLILSEMSTYTGLFNLTGLPSLTLPVGKSLNNLPINFQVVGKKYSDLNLIMIAKRISKIVS